MLKAMRLNGILPLVTVPLPSSNSESSVLEYELKFYEVSKLCILLILYKPGVRLGPPFITKSFLIQERTVL
jgi:hypothetical protein